MVWGGAAGTRAGAGAGGGVDAGVGTAIGSDAVGIVGAGMDDGGEEEVCGPFVAAGIAAGGLATVPEPLPPPPPPLPGSTAATAGGFPPCPNATVPSFPPIAIQRAIPPSATAAPAIPATRAAGRFVFGVGAEGLALPAGACERVRSGDCGADAPPPFGVGRDGASPAGSAGGAVVAIS